LKIADPKPAQKGKPKFPAMTRNDLTQWSEKKKRALFFKCRYLFAPQPYPVSAVSQTPDPTAREFSA
jgi:hypothetical protein